MGLEMNFDRSCTVDLSPNIVLLTHGHRSHVENRSTKGKLKRKDDLLSIKEDFVEISFHRYHSASCKSVPSRPVVNVDLKRGSIYQSSKEVQYIKKMGTVEGRRKVQMPHSSNKESSHNRSAETIVIHSWKMAHDRDGSIKDVITKLNFIKFEEEKIPKEVHQEFLRVFEAADDDVYEALYKAYRSGYRHPQHTLSEILEGRIGC